MFYRICDVQFAFLKKFYFVLFFPYTRACTYMYIIYYKHKKKHTKFIISDLWNYMSGNYRDKQLSNRSSNTMRGKTFSNFEKVLPAIFCILCHWWKILLFLHSCWPNLTSRPTSSLINWNWYFHIAWINNNSLWILNFITYYQAIRLQ